MKKLTTRSPPASEPTSTSGSSMEVDAQLQPSQDSSESVVSSQRFPELENDLQQLPWAEFLKRMRETGTSEYRMEIALAAKLSRASGTGVAGLLIPDFILRRLSEALHGELDVTEVRDWSLDELAAKLTKQTKDVTLKAFLESRGIQHKGGRKADRCQRIVELVVKTIQNGFL